MKADEDISNKWSFNDKYSTDCHTLPSSMCMFKAGNIHWVYWCGIVFNILWVFFCFPCSSKKLIVLSSMRNLWSTATSRWQRGRSECWIPPTMWKCTSHCEFLPLTWGIRYVGFWWKMWRRQRMSSAITSAMQYTSARPLLITGIMTHVGLALMQWHPLCVTQEGG